MVSRRIHESLSRSRSVIREKVHQKTDNNKDELSNDIVPNHLHMTKADVKVLPVIPQPSCILLRLGQISFLLFDPLNMLTGDLLPAIPRSLSPTLPLYHSTQPLGYCNLNGLSLRTCTSQIAFYKGRGFLVCLLERWRAAGLCPCKTHTHDEDKHNLR
ncbi:hypothetical protein Tco_0860494 [Tanacetum coccineum]|uniref:Uncharacterized protein n=1 Tax=Tanacetum coccineum TaxID=301880 RepID=A0ABQ5BI69_9ASTR